MVRTIKGGKRMCLVMIEMHVMQEKWLQCKLMWITHHKSKWWERISRIAAELKSDSSRITISYPMTGEAWKMMVKHSTHQKTKYVDDFDLPNLVCTAFDPVISRRENCDRHVQHMCWGKEGEGRRHRECVSGRGKLFPQPRLHVPDL